ncbi:MAG: hypothetical protein IJL91_05525 [Bacteroidales bacterium]|nr:hypothetical protein [Bacteroidales bacterium]
MDLILDAAIRNVIIDPEIEKAELYGKFIGAVPFCHDLSRERMILLNNIINQLTIGDIKVLKEFYPGTPIDLTSLEVSVRDGGDENDFERHIRLMKLQRLGLIVRQKPFRTDLALQNEKISTIGAEVLRFLGFPQKE